MAINLVIFASGSGTNAEAICKFFKNDSEVNVTAIFSNKPTAYVLQRAKSLDIPGVVFDRETFRSEDFRDILNQYEADFIILAGFLWKVPDYLIRDFDKKIINIHPALLPSYGGKGMYGHHVHSAVIQNKEDKSGITIHLVNEIYDDGRILFQAECPVMPDDTPDSLAHRIHQLEHQYFPQVVSDYIKNYNG